MKTTILIKHKNDLHWENPEVHAYPGEAKLQTILRDDPALFPFDDSRRPIVMADEFPVPIGGTTRFIDLVGVSAKGAITIVECKLKESPDVKYRLIGQLIQYAAGLWEMSYNDFDATWQALTQPPMTDVATWEKQKKPPLEEHVAETLGDRSGFDPSAFRLAVEDNLRTGRFTLVVAVDGITEALEDSVLYLSEHFGLDVRVVAMELGYVAHGDVEVLVPRTFGGEVAEHRPPTSAPVAWDATSFDAALRESRGAWALELATGLREWALTPEVGFELWFGKGKTFGTESLGLPDQSGKRHGLFNMWANGWVEFALGNFKFFTAYAEQTARLEVLHALSRIEGGMRKDRYADGWPQFNFDVLRDPAKLTDFKALLGEVVSRMRGAR
jgi:hypothetical protein